MTDPIYSPPTPIEELPTCRYLPAEMLYTNILGAGEKISDDKSETKKRSFFGSIVYFENRFSSSPAVLGAFLAASIYLFGGQCLRGEMQRYALLEYRMHQNQPADEKQVLDLVSKVRGEDAEGSAALFCVQLLFYSFMGAGFGGTCKTILENYLKNRKEEDQK